jgi:AraC-like DNA-binding protein
VLREQKHTFSAPDVTLAEFRVLPGHASWRQLNRTSDEGALIVFPRTPVGIEQLGRGRVVADATRVLFYPPGQEYRRELLSAQGDRCSYIGIGPAVLHDAMGGEPPPVAAQLEPQDFLLHHTLRRRVMAGQAHPDEVREALYVLVARTLGVSRAAKSSSRRGDRDVVEETRRVLARDLDEPLSLDDVARAVHLSPFHLARVFRQRTGTTVHAYRTSLRLRASLERIADGQPIAHVAADLGFASHAHLSDRFRREFGMSPQVWRAGLRSGRPGAKQQDRESLQGTAAIA